MIMIRLYLHLCIVSAVFPQVIDIKSHISHTLFASRSIWSMDHYKCDYSVSECAWQKYQLKGTLHYPELKNWSLTIRHTILSYRLYPFLRRFFFTSLGDTVRFWEAWPTRVIKEIKKKITFIALNPVNANLHTPNFSALIQLKWNTVIQHFQSIYFNLLRVLWRRVFDDFPRQLLNLRHCLSR